jgi:magnesium transporter
MLRCAYHDPDTGNILMLAREEVADASRRPGVLWLDLTHPGAEDLAWLAETFPFHHLAIDDTQNARERPKVDRYTDHYFFVLRYIRYHEKTHRVESHQLDCFVGPRYLVTLHREPAHTLDDVWQRWEQADVRVLSAPFLFYLLADATVDSILPIADGISEQIDDIDHAIVNTPDQEKLKRIFELRHALLSIRKVTAPLRDAFGEFIRMEASAHILGTADIQLYLNDIYDHLLRVGDSVDTYRDMLSASLEAYQSSISNRLNINMQRLTVAATILATASAVTGFYGMNLRGMGIASPWEYGATAVVIVLVGATALELWLFRRAGWL